MGELTSIDARSENRLGPHSLGWRLASRRPRGACPLVVASNPISTPPLPARGAPGRLLGDDRRLRLALPPLV